MLLTVLMRKIFRRISDVEIWACRNLPKTPSGKILKRSLKEFLRCGKVENLDPTDCSLVNPQSLLLIIKLKEVCVAQEKVAFVTGSSRGIGAAIAKRLAKKWI